VGVAAAGPAEDGHLRCVVQQARSRGHIRWRRAGRGAFVAHVHARFLLLSGQECDIPRQDHNRYAGLRDRSLNRNLEDTRHLRQMRDHLTEVAALREQALRVRLLEVAAANLARRYVCCDGEHRHAASVAIVEPVDQMQMTGP
jgi:hypothetical protein